MSIIVVLLVIGSLRDAWRASHPRRHEWPPSRSQARGAARSAGPDDPIAARAAGPSVAPSDRAGEPGDGGSRRRADRDHRPQSRFRPRSRSAPGHRAGPGIADRRAPGEERSLPGARRARRSGDRTCFLALHRSPRQDRIAADSIERGGEGSRIPESCVAQSAIACSARGWGSAWLPCDPRPAVRTRGARTRLHALCTAHCLRPCDFPITMGVLPSDIPVRIVPLMRLRVRAKQKAAARSLRDGPRLGISRSGAVLTTSTRANERTASTPRDEPCRTTSDRSCLKRA